MRSNIQSEMNKELDYKQLDSVAKSNFSARDRQKSEMINMLRQCSNMFSFVSEAKIQIIAERIQSQGYGCVELEPTIEKVLNDHDKFPSYKIILELIRSYTDKSLGLDDEYSKYVRMENTELDKVEQEFIKIFGEGKLQPYVEWWLQKCYPDLDKNMLSSFNSNVEIFKKPALFDWIDTGHSNNINRVIQTFARKADTQLRRKNNPRNKEYKRLK